MKSVANVRRCGRFWEESCYQYSKEGTITNQIVKYTGIHMITALAQPSSAAR